MRRPVLALLFASLTLLTLAAPASAGGSTDIVIGRPDGSFTVRSVPTATAESAVATAERQPGVAWAEVDVPLHATASVTPNDPQFPQQWGPTKLRAPEAWARTTGDPTVTVAVVDTGVDPTQPDLAGNVLPGADFVNDGKVGDPNGHGTGVAGVVAARGGNGIGIAGYCWRCTILPVRVLDADGSGSGSNVAAGIRWAADHGADIINLSMAGDSSSSALQSAVTYARGKGVILVAAAGNQTAAGQDLTRPQYPAAIPGVIGVVASTSLDALYPWSYHGSWAAVAAPGCVTTTSPGTGYQGECGTSFSSPAVAGVLGLARSVAPTASVESLVAALASTTAPMPAGSAAAGRVDAAAFLDAVAATAPALPTRLAGADASATSVQVSQAVRSKAPAVVLARTEDFADALTAGPLASQVGGPLLLTPGAALDPGVAAEVQRLGATTAYLAGGTGALDPAVEAGLRAIGVTSVIRLAGVNRYETAAAIAHQVGGSAVFLASGTSWPDAVAVSGLASTLRRPILLIGSSSVPSATTAALAGVASATVVGGTAVVGDAVLGQVRALGATVTRVAGVDRYATSAAVADLSMAGANPPRQLWLATGQDWRDALVAGPAAAASGAALLLSPATQVAGSPTTTWLSANSSVIRSLTIVGSEAAVGPAMVATLAAILS